LIHPLLSRPSTASTFLTHREADFPEFTDDSGDSHRHAGEYDGFQTVAFAVLATRNPNSSSATSAQAAD
jgi:hypothetical protein